MTSQGVLSDDMLSEEEIYGLEIREERSDACIGRKRLGVCEKRSSECHCEYDAEKSN